MTTVFFNPALGGDGSTYTEASFANGGHRQNFLPSLNNILGVANFTLTNANTASSSAVTAVNAKNAAELALDQFTDQYLGSKSSPPTVDNDGNPLLTGAIYFDSTKLALQVYTGTIWIDAAGAQASFKRFDFTATTGQSLFSVAPDQYTPNFIQVYLDGVLLDASDYIATNGTTITLVQPVNVGQTLSVHRFDSLDIANIIRVISASDLAPEDSLVFDDFGNATFNFNVNLNGSTNIGNTSTDITNVTGNVNFNHGIDVLSGNLNVGLNRTQGNGNLTVHQPSSTSSVIRLSNTTSGFGSTDGLEMFTDGLNAGFWNRENGNITFRTNNQTRLTIDNLGGLTYTGSLTGGTGVINIGSGQVFKDALGNISVLGSIASGGTGRAGSLTVNRSSDGAGIAVFESLAGTNDAQLRNAQGALLFSTAGAERLRLDSAGNLGLGVTPSAWASGWKVLQVGATAALSDNALGDVYLGSNWRFDGSSDKYITSNFANLYTQENGAHKWLTAPTGTAGAPISFGDPKMSLTQGGNLLVGTTIDSIYKLDVQTTSAGGFRVGSNTSDTYIIPDFFGTSVSSILTGSGTKTLAFGTGGGGAPIERARITSAGYFKASNNGTYVNPQGPYFEFNNDNSTNEVLRVFARGVAYSNTVINAETTATNAGAGFNFYSAVANGATVFRVQGTGQIQSTSTTITAISDQRVKENIRHLSDGLSKINALQPRMFDWKEGNGRGVKDDRGFIAQEFETVFPDMVEDWQDGDITYKALRADLIPVLVKAVQELSAQNATLEARLAALEAK